MIRSGAKWTLIAAFFIAASQYAFSQCSDENCGLVIRGNVIEVQVDRSTRHAVIFDIDVDVVFVNEGTAPVILFRPEAEGTPNYWLGGWSLYSKSYKWNEPVVGSGISRSVDRSDSYRKLAKALDVKEPPQNLTRILKPGESWRSKDRFRIHLRAERAQSSGASWTWDELLELGPVFQVSIGYELSPWNVENFKPGLIRKLKKRWARHGNVVVDSDSEERGVSNSRVSSERMEIDFSKAKEKPSR